MWRPRPSVRSSVCDLVSTTKFLSDFREIRYRSYLQKVAEQTNGSPTLLKGII